MYILDTTHDLGSSALTWPPHKTQHIPVKRCQLQMDGIMCFGKGSQFLGSFGQGGCIAWDTHPATKSFRSEGDAIVQDVEQWMLFLNLLASKPCVEHIYVERESESESEREREGEGEKEQKRKERKKERQKDRTR